MSSFEVTAVFSQFQTRLRGRATALLLTLEARLDRIMIAWLLVAGFACALRIAFSPLAVPFDLSALVPYTLLVLAPMASMVLALRWFAQGDRQSQPQFRLSCVGRWTNVGRHEARAHSLYGTGGIMVSLLVGLLLNVPVRALEYLGSMPAISGPVPEWLSVLRAMMTLDVVLMSSLYAIAFVAALRRVPLFPRLLVAIWGLDLAMQLLTAQLVARAPGLPASVASALYELLDGNVTKVLISAGLWLPYLILSRRVNVTFRHRIPA
jgi:hypothetical protein